MKIVIDGKKKTILPYGKMGYTTKSKAKGNVTENEKGDAMVPLEYDPMDVKARAEYKASLARMDELLAEAQRITLYPLVGQEFFYMRMQLQQQRALIQQKFNQVSEGEVGDD